MTIARAGSNKSIDVNQVGNEEVAKCLVAGRSFVGISTDPQRFLPTTLLLSADVTVKLVPPDAKSVRVLLRTLLPPMGRIPSSRIADTSGLDLNDLVSIFRSGSTASDALERLATLAMRRRQSSPHVEGAPILSNAIEFGGAAQIFGLNFVKDVQDWRQGSIQWAEADHGAILHSEPGHGKNFFVNSLALAAGTGLVVAKISDFSPNAKDTWGMSSSRSGPCSAGLERKRPALGRRGSAGVFWHSTNWMNCLLETGCRGTTPTFFGRRRRDVDEFGFRHVRQ